MHLRWNKKLQINMLQEMEDRCHHLITNDLIQQFLVSKNIYTNMVNPQTNLLEVDTK